MNKEIISHFKDDERRRKEFNALSIATFGIDFETLYEKNLWQDQFVNYGYIVDDKLVACVSCHQLVVEKDGQAFNAVSVGAVMTDKAYRKNGYVKALFDVIFETYDAEVMYLSANETVLEFYPRFGFKPVAHLNYLLEEIPTFDPTCKGDKIDLDQSYEEVLTALNTCMDHTKNFAVKKHEYIRMFYLLFVYKNCIYKHKEGFIVCYKEDDTLYVHDLILTESVDLKTLLSGYTDGVKSIVFHFDVNLDDVKEIVKEDTFLFVKTNEKTLNAPWALPNAAIT